MAPPASDSRVVRTGPPVPHPRQTQFEPWSDDATRARGLEQLRAARPKAIAVAFELVRFDGQPLGRFGDPRQARIASIALVWPGEGSGAGQVAEGEHPQAGAWWACPTPQAVMDLASLWEGAKSPYVIFERAQSACAALVAAGATLPPRMGCIASAATLLAAGADGQRDDRSVQSSVEALFGEQAPPLQRGDDAAKFRAAWLTALMREYTPRLRNERLAKIYETELAVVPAVVDMELAGMPVDAAQLERIGASWVDELGSDPPPTAPRRKRLEKLISTYRYWSRDYVDVDGRIRCRLNPLATDSGRFSCSDPNLQQVPSEHTAPGMRACFRPAPSHRFIVADYAQIELRVAAALAPCDALAAVFREGRDVHRATAATLARKREDEVTARERQLAKAVNFGFLFGMGAKRFRSYAASSYGLELDPAQAQRAREAFFATFPGIQAWHRRIGQLDRQGGPPRDITVRTALGRQKRFEAGRFSFNAALNIPVQGTAAEGFKLAMQALHERLPSLGGRGVLVVHDEYIAEVPAEHATAACALVEATMVEQMQRVVPEVPIEVDAKVAGSWSEK